MARIGFAHVTIDCAPNGLRVVNKDDNRKGVVSNAGCPVGRGCQVRYDDGERMIYADREVFDRHVRTAGSRYVLPADAISGISERFG